MDSLVKIPEKLFLTVPAWKCRTGQRYLRFNRDLNLSYTESKALSIYRIESYLCGDQREYWEVEGKFSMGFLGTCMI
jgi:hypothetical protein